MEKVSCVYQIRNLVNGKVYVGSTGNFKKRNSTHWNGLANNKHHNIHLQRSYNKYGKDSFVLEIIEYCEIEDLIEEEQRCFDAYVEYLGRKNLYNIGDFVDNSMRGKSPSKETRRKLSLSHIGNFPSDETRRKLSQARKGKRNPNWGKSVSEETRRKMSEVHKNISEETRRKMSQARKGRFTGKDNHNFGKPSPDRKSVLQLDRHTNKPLVKFTSIRQASKETLATESGISKCCNAKQKTSGGFKWEFHN